MKSTFIYPRSFTYNNGKKTNREVLVTAQNQNVMRGFDISDLPKGQVTRIKNAWNKIQNQNWTLSTKESNVIKTVGKSARNNFRTFKRDKMTKVQEM
jgi:hypothetical protein|tara:strand:- start:770 stop:1060 length:291 start_codon:yes stop_codon:yes gene_type:complete